MKSRELIESPFFVAIVVVASLFAGLGLLASVSSGGEVATDELLIERRRAFTRMQIFEELGRIGDGFIRDRSEGEIGDRDFLGKTSWREDVRIFVLDMEALLVVVWIGTDGEIGTGDDISRVIVLETMPIDSGGPND